MHHLLYEELAITKLANQASLLYLFTAFVELAIPRLLGLEISSLLEAYFAV